MAGYSGVGCLLNWPEAPTDIESAAPPSCEPTARHCERSAAISLLCLFPHHVIVVHFIMRQLVYCNVAKARVAQQCTVARAHQVADSHIAQCQVWLAEHYAEAAPVAAMTRMSGLSERSFKRRFAQVTGMTPMEYVHTLRLEEAKQMLESGDLPVEAIAGEVGYEDAAFFSRLFRRKVELTPAQYRKRFGGLRKALQSGSF